MTIRPDCWLSFKELVNLKNSLLIGLIIGACLTAPTLIKASITYVGDGNVILNANGGGYSFYAVNNSPTFNGNLGGLSIQTGQTLYLGGQLQTSPGGGYYPGASSTFMGYQIDGTSVSGTINLTFAYNTYPYGIENDLWEVSGAHSSGNLVNLDQGLSAGTYTLEIWFGAVNSDGSGTVYDKNGANNFSATFSVVPEPITLALPIFGGLVLTAGLVRRFISRRTPAAV